MRRGGYGPQRRADELSRLRPESGSAASSEGPPELVADSAAGSEGVPELMGDTEDGPWLDNADGGRASWRQRQQWSEQQALLHGHWSFPLWVAVDMGPGAIFSRAVFPRYGTTNGPGNTEEEVENLMRQSAHIFELRAAEIASLPLATQLAMRTTQARRLPSAGSSQVQPLVLILSPPGMGSIVIEVRIAGRLLRGIGRLGSSSLLHGTGTMGHPQRSNAAVVAGQAGAMATGGGGRGGGGAADTPTTGRGR